MTSTNDGGPKRSPNRGRGTFNSILSSANLALRLTALALAALTALLATLLSALPSGLLLLLAGLLTTLLPALLTALLAGLIHVFVTHGEFLLFAGRSRVNTTNKTLFSFQSRAC